MTRTCRRFAVAFGSSVVLGVWSAAVAEQAAPQIAVLEAFNKARIVVSFEAAPGNVRDELNLRMLNVGQQPLRIVVPKGRTVFELNSESIQSVAIDSGQARVVIIGAGSSQALAVRQTGKQRVVGGKLTVTKTPDGKELRFDNLEVEAVP